MKIKWQIKQKQWNDDTWRIVSPAFDTLKQAEAQKNIMERSTKDWFKLKISTVTGRIIL